MTISRRAVITAGLQASGGLVAASLTCHAAGAVASRVIPIWPEGVPDLNPDGGPERLEDGRLFNVHVPTITWTPPLAGTANGAAMVICPGGGYVRLALANEAEKVAAFLRPLGVATFVLHYRMREYGHPAPLRDVVRAIRLVRSRAAEFGIDASRVGVAGASAGGHLAGSAATMFDDAEARTGAPLDAVSGRPDFVVLLYPVVTMLPPFAHPGSVTALLGAAPTPDQLDRLSIERRVTTQTPPVFVVHTAEDATVPIENTLQLVAALRRVGVPTECHLYERGRHGFGISAGLGPTSAWQDRLAEWLASHGWLAHRA